MVDDIDAPVAVSPAVAPTIAPQGFGVRVSTLPRSVLDGTLHHSNDTTELGPRFIGQVAMAAHDDVVVVGHVDDGHVEVWRGDGGHLAHVATIDAPSPSGGLVALVWYRNEWHLFARNEHGRSSHLVSTDLRTWAPLQQLTHGFPAFGVSGVAVRNGELLLAGRIFVDNTAFGWGLLRGDGRGFEARPVPLPLATQLGVVGPAVNRHGDAVLLLDSGHTRMVARSTGTSWTLGLLVPEITVLAAFADGAELWLAGHDVVTGVPSLARLNHPQVIALPESSFGSVRSAIVHDRHLVLAREC